MAFIDKTRYFDVPASVVLTNADEGLTLQNTEAANEQGLIVANTLYGANRTPSNSYVLNSYNETLEGFNLGKHTTVQCPSGDTVPIAMTGFTINTAAGAAPTLDVSGEQIESDAANAEQNTLATGLFEIYKEHKAQILFDAFTLGGTGNYLQSANYTASCTLTKATKDGVCVSHDVSNGRIEASLTITQTADAIPTITTGTGWQITSPLTCSNPDASYPSWTCTLTKYLTDIVIQAPR